jgi:hypothetical protein
MRERETRGGGVHMGRGRAPGARGPRPSRDGEREMCPWAVSISILVIRCPTH